MSAYRFLDSPHVTPEEIVRTAANQKTDGELLLLKIRPRSTSSHDLSDGEALGPAGHDGKTSGFFGHAMVAVDV
jgi:hypothetical protein